MRGKLVVFEGLDRAGKSTQCLKLVETLQGKGHKVRHMRFPGTADYTTLYVLGFGGVLIIYLLFKLQASSL